MGHILFVRMSHMARVRYKGKYGPCLLSHFLVHYTIEGYSLKSLSGVVDDYQNTHGHFNKCD